MAVGVAAVCVLGVTPAQAEAPQVNEQYELGKQALKGDKPAEALRHFKAALSQADSSLGSTWQMMLAVALTYNELKRPAYAAETFRRFLEVTESHADLMTEKWRTRREVVRKELTALEQTLSETHAVVLVKSTPAGAQISLDGARAGVDGDAVTPSRLWLSPGEHIIALALDGYQPITHTLTTRAGQLDSFSPTLQAIAPAAAEAPAPEAPQTPVVAVEGEGSGGGIGPAILLGSAGVSAIIGGVMLGLSQSEFAKAQDIDSTAKQLQETDPVAFATQQGDLELRYDTAKSAHETYSLVGALTLGVAGAAAVGGVLWLLLADDAPASEPDTSFGLVPTRGGLHGHATWRF